ncbi:MAG: hypothetical protein IJ240_10540 [Clostridia bacterium]|nr:hypothetical protein [Clostridia bacterium]
MRDLMEKKVEASLLLSYYGALLTDTQQQMSTLYYDEDYSLSEIAAQFHVSRQSVHDTVARSLQQLEQTEEKLGFISRDALRERRLAAGIRELSAMDGAPARRAIEVLSALGQEEEQ